METLRCEVSDLSLWRSFRPTGVGEGYTVTGVYFRSYPERVFD